MSVFIRRDRLKEAILRLADWRGKVQAQGSAHLFPFLSLLRKGVNSNGFVQYEEKDDFDFFDTYFRVGGPSEKPYFDPLTREFRISTHPHSNAATLRKNTFENRWKAGESSVEGGVTRWKLAPDAAEIVAQKVMTRRGTATRVNVLDLAVWLFKSEEFPDDADSSVLLSKFRSTFPMEEEAFNRLFEYTDEPAPQLYSVNRLEPKDMASLVSQLAFEDRQVLAHLKTPPKELPGSGNSLLAQDDPIFTEVRGLLALGSSGVILRGAPGTSKSWYAWNIALAFTENDTARIYRVQFHPSYGYEDFVQGYLPHEDAKSGFKIDDRVFMEAVKAANRTDKPIVFIVDEINRGDTSRIFGELLTYIEHGWRGIEFTSKFGERISIPRNLIVLATMNPHDRSITQLDMALLRRFDHVDVHPSVERASVFLQEAGMADNEADLILEWFEKLQQLLPFGIGHAYMLNVGDIARLGLVWRYRILPFCENILEFDPARLESVQQSFEALDRRLRNPQTE